MPAVFQEAAPILKRIEQAGFEAYFVGGSVRDYLLGKKINDIDIATSATPEEIKGIFGQTIDIGIQHGTVMVIAGGKSYEITTFRTESSYVDFRRPSEVAFIRELREDLQRRDFTMNAMAMDKQGNIIDYFSGREALKQQQIETVGNADERFKEDALRMMRAIRFVSTLGFSLEEKTYASIRQNRPLLAKIAIERITQEFEKLLSGKYSRKSLQLIGETNLHEYLPMLKEKKQVILQVSKMEIDYLTIDEMWTLLLWKMDITANKEIDVFLRQWKLPVKKIKKVQKIIAAMLGKQKNNWTCVDLYKITLEIACSAEKLSMLIWEGKLIKEADYIKKAFEQLPIQEKAELAIHGKDLLNWSSKPPGAWIKEAIEAVEYAVLEQKVKNDKQAIKEWLESCHLI
ncbi:CCA tRNA nucleotidyltransferase [Niallia sp. NCCP-28]|uniref:CCA tRNA nucleotidyltransferase n=1 Tax=Niallia sp. NCCP-28 TaxID=2934712 RepID=UPI00208BC486|nr:CCA tRNA nucleotidyltransferase [Niallia sp. NCCP-28]GKU80986.1 CCA-adding enzyme [Niallia sp. NCCP-28]